MESEELIETSRSDKKARLRVTQASQLVVQILGQAFL